MLDDFLEDVNFALGSSGKWRGKKFLVAFSGGIDSTVLLEAMAVLRESHGFELHAAHVHHGLQEIAETWPAHCEQQARQRGIPFHLKTVRVENCSELSLESAARMARYKALGEIEADVVVLGQHLDDQAESVLLQLLRGSGPAGLSGMGFDTLPASHPLHTAILRPLLSISRSRIEKWAAERRLQWIEDPSNQSLKMDRNFLRHTLSPVLNGRFRSWQEGMARSAHWAAEAQGLLVELAHLDLAKLLNQEKLESQANPNAIDPACLPASRAAYLSLPEHRLRNLLRVMLAERGAAAPPAPRLMEWIRQLHLAKADRVPMMIWQNWVLRCWNQKLWLEQRTRPPEMLQVPESIRLYVEMSVPVEWDGLNGMRGDWHGMGTFEFAWQEANEEALPSSGVWLPYRLREDCGPLVLKTANGSAWIQPGVTQPHRGLRKLFQEKRVPPWRRARIPMLHCDDRLIAVPGLALDPAWHAPKGSPGWQLIWRDSALACYNN